MVMSETDLPFHGYGVSATVILRRTLLSAIAVPITQRRLDEAVDSCGLSAARIYFTAFGTW